MCLYVCYSFGGHYAINNIVYYTIIYITPFLGVYYTLMSLISMINSSKEINPNELFDKKGAIVVFLYGIICLFIKKSLT